MYMPHVCFKSVVAWHSRYYLEGISCSDVEGGGWWSVGMFVV